MPHTPPFLQQNDEIRIVSTARKVEADFIKNAVSEIERRGFSVSLGANLFKESNQFAGSDEERLSDLNAAIRNPDVKAVFAARGGYGTARLLEGADLTALKANPKWIVGYSDLTALMSHLWEMAEIESIHGTMPVNYSANTKAALDSLFHLLSGKTVSYEFEGRSMNRAGEASGNLIGGNLSVLYSLLGSSAQIKTKGCVLFLEDLDEYLYHIDRMMTALDRAGMLKDLAGLIVGGMTDMNDNTIPFGKTAEKIILEKASKYDFPVSFGFPSGHQDDNRAWIHGKKIRLTVRDDQPCIVEYV